MFGIILSDFLKFKYIMRYIPKSLSRSLKTVYLCNTWIFVICFKNCCIGFCLLWLMGHNFSFAL